MFSGIGATGFILIFLVALLLFGPNRLPELGRAFGRTLREFREGAREMMEDHPKPHKEDRTDKASMQEPEKEQGEKSSGQLPE